MIGMPALFMARVDARVGEVGGEVDEDPSEYGQDEIDRQQRHPVALVGCNETAVIQRQSRRTPTIEPREAFGILL